MRKRLLFLTVTLLVLLALIIGAIYMLRSQDSLRAKRTATTMSRLGNALVFEIDQGGLEGLQVGGFDLLLYIHERHPATGPPVDGWGSQLILEKVGDEQYSWRLVSLGRNRQRGTCCVKFTRKQWDQDAVLSVSQAHGVEWLQIW